MMLCSSDTGSCDHRKEAIQAPGGPAADRYSESSARTTKMTLPLTGIRVLDLSRVLAGPLVAQMLGDLGASVIKIERPGGGDDSRNYGPPFLISDNGATTGESGFYLSANRNKQSVTVDLSTPEGQDIVRRIALKS